MELMARVGVLTFSFVDARIGSFDPPIRFPLTLLEDGTLLEATVSEGVVFLLVDQRLDRSDLARIEFWQCQDVPECEIGGLLAVCSARVSGSDLGSGGSIVPDRGSATVV